MKKIIVDVSMQFEYDFPKDCSDDDMEMYEFGEKACYDLEKILKDEQYELLNVDVRVEDI